MHEIVKNLLSNRGFIMAFSILVVTVFGIGMDFNLSAILFSALLFAGSYLYEPAR